MRRLDNNTSIKKETCILQFSEIIRNMGKYRDDTSMFSKWESFRYYTSTSHTGEDMFDEKFINNIRVVTVYFDEKMCEIHRVENGFNDGSGEDWKNEQPDQDEVHWKASGLLEGLSTEDKDKLVPFLQESYDFLLKQVQVTNSVEKRIKAPECFIPSMIFSICRRLVELRFQSYQT